MVINSRASICILLVLLSVILSFTVRSKEQALTTNLLLDIAVPGYPEEVYPTADKIKQCRHTNLSLPNVPKNRVYIELVIICQALTYGDVHVNFRLLGAAGYQRAMRFARNGEADLIAETIWLDDIDHEKFYVSAPLLKKGEFFKGVYTNFYHPLREMPLSEIKLSKFSAVIEGTWYLDIQKLQQLTSSITHASSYRSIYRMLKAKRADFTLLEFSADSMMKKHYEGISLYPVEGVKVAFDHSRHLVVPKSSPHAKKLISALNDGIEKMRQNGELANFYDILGIGNTKTKHWQVINSQAD